VDAAVERQAGGAQQEGTTRYAHIQSWPWIREKGGPSYGRRIHAAVIIGQTFMGLCCNKCMEGMNR
jgi:hypothetical protein